MKKIWFIVLCMICFVMPLYSAQTSAMPTFTGPQSGMVIGGLDTWTDAGSRDIGPEDLLVGDELIVNNGIINMPQVFNDVPAEDTESVFNVAIASQTLVDGTSTFTGGSITSPIIPMNLVFVSSAADTVQSALDFACTATIVGTDGRGEAQTEDVIISSDNAASLGAYATVTSIAYSGSTVSTAEGDVTIKAGLGTILGLSNSIYSSDDVIAAYLDDNGTTTDDDGTVNTTYNTWTPDTAGDGTTDVYTIIWKVRIR